MYETHFYIHQTEGLSSLLVCEWLGFLIVFDARSLEQSPHEALEEFRTRSKSRSF